MKIGLQLDKIASEIFYDKVVDKQTPDWIMNANSQVLLVEVVRVNLHENSLNEKIIEFKNPEENDLNIIARSTSSNVLDSKYFYGAQGKIEKQEISYRGIIETRQCPFIICIDCSETDLFTFYNDFFDFFIGNSKSGFFFSDEYFGKNVTGLFILVPFDGYKFISNPIAVNKLNDENLNAFIEICH